MAGFHGWALENHSFPGSPANNIREATGLLVGPKESRVCRSSDSLANLGSVLF